MRKNYDVLREHGPSSMFLESSHKDAAVAKATARDQARRDRGTVYLVYVGSKRIARYRADIRTGRVRQTHRLTHA